MTTVKRYHDISCGHRVVGHEGKCANLHGHNYRFNFVLQGELDPLGRVVDFSVIKSQLCMWLEEFFDHKFLMWEQDPLLPAVKAIDDTVVSLPFNPTAEALAAYMVNVIAPIQLAGTGAKLISCEVEETRKCSASYAL